MANIPTEDNRRGGIGTRLLLFSVAFVSTFMMALAYWYGADRLGAIVEDVRVGVIRGGLTAAQRLAEETMVKLGINPMPPAKVGINPGPAPKLESTTTVPTKIPSPTIEVIDGDTIRRDGLVYRLVGFDAPETINAKCRQEWMLGDRATTRLREIVSGDSLELNELRCSCPRRTQGTQSCNYGRRCGMLKANGEDVGEILIREGLARRYVCSTNGCPQRQPWC
jgi:endonuclease YncB( thermonuclease family)